MACCFQILRSVYDGEARAVPVHIYYPRRSYFMEFLQFCVTLIAQVGELKSNLPYNSNIKTIYFIILLQINRNYIMHMILN